MKQSQWMKGLLWAEDYVGNDPDKISKLVDDLLKSVWFSRWVIHKEFRLGAISYIKHYEERLK